MKYLLVCTAFLFVFSCKNSHNTTKPTTDTDISAISTKEYTEFKVLDSKYINTDELWQPFHKDLEAFTEKEYQALKPLILEQDIPTLQAHIQNGNLTYENLTKFYLYRIRKFDRENALSLNSVISLNPNVISEAQQKDEALKNRMRKHLIFGMPILLKDNINTATMPTTAGAVAFQNNTTADAFIVERLKENGALILGKANLSEWAYFFCGDCPSGYSAIGGQTLNPYGRKVMDTGGSSSGSGVAVAANFCVAAIGSETSGSILSPSSQNSVVGLKPTIGVLSRSGIIPISSTLDTPGPITKNVTDSAIVLDAMLGYDGNDSKSMSTNWDNGSLYENFDDHTLRGKRFGAFKELLEDSLYVRALTDLKSKGAIIIEIDEEKVKLPGFIRLLNLDMQNDFPSYVEASGDPSLHLKSIQDVIAFNKKDSITTMPYGQKLFEGVVTDRASEAEFDEIKTILKTNGRLFFDTPMETLSLHGFLSVNNYHAGAAAVVEYPAITVPMGYKDNGEPKGLTFIAKPLSENDLLSWAYAYEQASHRRMAPKNYN
ncbi:amidase family protein [Gelidibacter salicanalis]|uniref:Amidase n=1 Tax=Gelidibacter salicanalis TaxID=291193 RepID=A0A934NKU0_9FLAO|nr:amidase family protein [Gelidibacter salicanalis]MBJ7882347.1 amidase [Gelidibacter salicanalis]